MGAKKIMDAEVKKQSSPAAPLEVFFDDPRLHMTIAGRMIVRVAAWTVYLVVIGATVTFLISSIPQVRFAGIFLILMLADFLLHRGEGDLPMAEVPKTGKINAADVLRPSASSALERAFDA